MNLILTQADKQLLLFALIIIGAFVGFILMLNYYGSTNNTTLPPSTNQTHKNTQNSDSQPDVAAPTNTLPEVNECNNCPESNSDWSICFQGSQYKAIYYCDASTGYTCKQNILTQKCGPSPPPIQQQSDANPNISGTMSDSQYTYYQQQICNKIQPTNSAIRNTAVSIARASPGQWNISQLVDLYIWMKDNISYVSDPNTQNYFASATESLNDAAGDCEDQAILVSSLIQSVGGTSKVVVAPNCQHAFASVFISSSKEELDARQKEIADIYFQKGIYDLSGQNMFYYKDDQGYWLFVDPAGGYYLGDTYAGCRTVSSFYPLSCNGIAPTNESRTDYTSQNSSSAPNLDVKITQCNPSTNFLQGLGEVTDVYVTVSNYGPADAHNVDVVAHASDEDQQFKNTANFQVIKAGQVASVKLTVDTQQDVQTLITLKVTSTEGAGAEIQRNCS